MNCPNCKTEIPSWWARNYCAACGVRCPQTPHQIEIQRLRDALTGIDNVMSYDYDTMPESGRKKAFEIVREIISENPPVKPTA